MRRALIIAKYKEDIAWPSQVSDYEVVVYSKQVDEPDTTLLTLPNIGRESHTYLHYIVSNYGDLPDLCVFAQANPFDHCPDFLTTIANLRSPLGYLALSQLEALYDSYGYPQLGASPLSIDKLYFGEFFEKILGQKAPMLFYARMNGLFAVDRETILKRPLAFYQRCLDSLQDITIQSEERWTDLNSVETHFFERLWYFIFTPDWDRPDETSNVHGMPMERVKLVLPLLEKWPAEVQKNGPLQASRILLAASEILNKTV